MDGKPEKASWLVYSWYRHIRFTFAAFALAPNTTFLLDKWTGSDGVGHYNPVGRLRTDRLSAIALEERSCVVG